LSRLENIDESNKPLAANEVSLKFLAAPINPADINIANGTYGKQPPLPAFGGNEGVAVVQQTGAAVKNVKAGDWVVPAVAPFGTWRQFARAESTEVLRVPNDIPVAYAATLMVNPGTAYRLLRDFAALKPGDVIIQNGANSMVGLAVVQMAREMGVKTINIIRSDRCVTLFQHFHFFFIFVNLFFLSLFRPNGEQTLRLLANLGGDINIPDSFLSTYDFKEMVKELPPIKLGFNCVGGDVALDMARLMGHGSSLVTYGGMSKKPLSLPADLITAKQLKMEGFWMSEWNNTHSHEEREQMLSDIAGMVRDQKLSFFYEMHDFDDFPHALTKSQESFRLRKVVLNMDYPDRMKEHDARPESDYEIFEAPVM
jgi:trans-2-enoyl-CoA reductase